MALSGGGVKGSALATSKEVAVKIRNPIANIRITRCFLLKATSIKRHATRRGQGQAATYWP